MDISDKDRAAAERVRLAEAAGTLSRLAVDDPGVFVDQLQTAEIPVLGLLVNVLHSGHTVPEINPGVRALLLRQVADVMNARHRQAESIATEAREVER